MVSEKATEQGQVTDKNVEYYLDRAKEGLAGVIVEPAFISENGRCSRHQLSAADDDKVEGLSRLASSIKNTGAVAILQLNHGGAKAYSKDKSELLSPSGVLAPNVTQEVTPRQMTLGEIAQVKADFIKATERAMEAGFDGVEIHGAHGFLLNQFNSPLTNFRQDKYGGSRKNRARLSLEVASDLKEVVGNKLLLYRLGATDGYDKGLTMPDAIWIAKELVRNGVDIIDVSGGHGGYRGHTRSQGYFVPIAVEIKQNLTQPVMVAGGISSPQYANEVIEEEGLDFVGVGRALLSRPDWPYMAKQELINRK